MVIAMDDVKSIIAKYLSEFTREKDRLRQLEHFVADSKPELLTDRANNVGQITASADRH